MWSKAWYIYIYIDRYLNRPEKRNLCMCAGRIHSHVTFSEYFCMNSCWSRIPKQAWKSLHTQGKRYIFTQRCPICFWLTQRVQENETSRMFRWYHLVCRPSRTSSGTGLDIASVLRDYSITWVSLVSLGRWLSWTGHSLAQPHQSPTCYVVAVVLIMAVEFANQLWKPFPCDSCWWGKHWESGVPGCQKIVIGC